METFRKIFERKLNLKNDDELEQFIDKYVDQNYSEEQLSTDRAWKMHAEIADAIKNKEIRNENDLVNFIDRYANH